MSDANTTNRPTTFSIDHHQINTQPPPAHSSEYPMVHIKPTKPTTPHHAIALSPLSASSPTSHSVTPSHPLTPAHTPQIYHIPAPPPPYGNGPDPSSPVPRSLLQAQLPPRPTTPIDTSTTPRLPHHPQPRPPSSTPIHTRKIRATEISKKPLPPTGTLVIWPTSLTNYDSTLPHPPPAPSFTPPTDVAVSRNRYTIPDDVTPEKWFGKTQYKRVVSYLENIVGLNE